MDGFRLNKKNMVGIYISILNVHPKMASEFKYRLCFLDGLIGFDYFKHAPLDVLHLIYWGIYRRQVIAIIDLLKNDEKNQLFKIFKQFPSMGEQKSLKSLEDYISFSASHYKILSKCFTMVIDEVSNESVLFSSIELLRINNDNVCEFGPYI
ncbi:hypothetical protein RB653_009995 [Dictyostelium firmibasis]|uniref:Uncharacterized protein n=1 Tax=Dictyostelium firmibasis TaxID=79012 RepID=A0AAN7TJG3_9MYCE